MHAELGVCMPGFDGRPPKDDDKKRSRTPLLNAWVDVLDVPFDGPALDRLRPDYPWTSVTRAWWEAVRTMPHCAMWTVADWTFAAETALLVQSVNSGDGGLTASMMGQLTRRELELGMTEPSRRQQRIRYVSKVEVPSEAPAPRPTEARRQRLRAVAESA